MAFISNMAVTWNAAGTAFDAIKMNVTNTASAAGSDLLDLQIGGVSAFQVNKTVFTGTTSNGILFSTFAFGYPAMTSVAGSDRGYIAVAQNAIDFGGTISGTNFTVLPSNNATLFRNGHALGFASNAGTNNFNSFGAIDGADDIIAVRRTTNAQTFRWYGNYVSSTDYHRGGISVAKTTLSNVNGASVTATSLIPDGAVVIGVTTKVTTALGTGGGTTGYQVGDGSDTDRWGSITGTAAGTSSDNRDATATTVSLFTSANNVVLTANGGSFNGTGVIDVNVFYMIAEAD